jgi:chromosome segregation ATPase
MSRMLVQGLRFAALFVAVAMAWSLVGRAQQPSAQTDLVPALLVEIRGLRAAMEQMAAAGPRVQLTLGRLQMQEQRIVNQIRRLDGVTASLVEARKKQEAASQRLKDLTETPSEPPADASAERARRWELEEARKEAARINADVQRLATEEAMLTQDVATEQGRWADFNQRLEEIERALARR